MPPTSSWRSWRPATTLGGGAGAGHAVARTQLAAAPGAPAQIRAAAAVGRRAEAAGEIKVALDLDRMEFGALWERELLGVEGEALPGFAALAGGNAEIFLAISLDYAHAGMWTRGHWHCWMRPPVSPARTHYRGWSFAQSGQRAAAAAAFAEAAAQPVDLCFPTGLTTSSRSKRPCRPIPRTAMRPTCWASSRTRTGATRRRSHAGNGRGSWTTAFRPCTATSGWPTFNKRHDPAEALAAYAAAFPRDPHDARLFFELDQLYKRLNQGPAERLARLQAHAALVEERPTTCRSRDWAAQPPGPAGRGLRARLMARQLSSLGRRRGQGHGPVCGSLVAKARAHLARGEAQAAIQCLEAAQVYPYNLGEGKLHGAAGEPSPLLPGHAYRIVGRRRAGRSGVRACGDGAERAHLRHVLQRPAAGHDLYQGLARRSSGASNTHKASSASWSSMGRRTCMTRCR